MENKSCTCKQRFAENKEAWGKWLDRNPKACKRCQSWGGVDSSCGDGYNEPIVDWFDICPDCAEKSLCPQCGGSWPGQEDGEIICPSCEYDFNNRYRGFIPPHNEGPCNFCLKKEYEDYIDGQDYYEQNFI